MVARRGNTLGAPPRLTGNPSQDIVTLLQWVTDLYQALVLERNTVGSIDEIDSQIAALEARIDDLTEALRSLNLGVVTSAREVSPGLPLRDLVRTSPELFGGATIETDFRAVFQRAMLWSKQEKKKLAFMEEGLFLVLSRVPDTDTAWNRVTATGDQRRLLLVEDGMDITLGPKTAIFGVLDSTIGVHGLFMSRWNNDGINNPALRPVFRLEGGVFGKLGEVVGDTYQGGLRGNVFCLVPGRGSVLKNVRVEGWQDGEAFRIYGDGLTMERPVSRYPAEQPGTAGIRFCGGRDNVVTLPDIDSYDDALQLAVLGNPGIPWGAAPVIQNTVFRNGKVRSRASRAMIASIPDDGAGASPARILDSGFENIIGTDPLGNMGAVRNEAGLNERAIDNIWFVWIEGDQNPSDEASDRNFFDIFGGSDAVGSVGLVTIDGITSERVNSRFLRVDGKVRKLVLRRARMRQRPSRPLQNAVSFFGGDRVILDDCDFRSANSGVIDVAVFGAANAELGTGGTSLHLGGTTSFPSTTPVQRQVGKVTMRDVVALDVPNDRFAFRFDRVTQGVEIEDGGMRKTATATTARAISHGPDAGTLRMDDSDWREAGHATPLLLTGPPSAYDFGPDNLGLPSSLRAFVRRRTRRHPGYTPARRYPLVADAAVLAAGTPVPAVDRLYLYPARVDDPIVVEKLETRVAATAGTTARFALWLPGGNGMPTGFSVCGSNEFVSVASTNTDAATSGDLDTAVGEGMVWVGVAVHGSAPICQHLTSGVALARLVGGSTTQNATSSPQGAYWIALDPLTDITALDLTGAALTATVPVGIPAVVARVK